MVQGSGCNHWIDTLYYPTAEEEHLEGEGCVALEGGVVEAGTDETDFSLFKATKKLGKMVTTSMVRPASIFRRKKAK